MVPVLFGPQSRLRKLLNCTRFGHGQNFQHTSTLRWPLRIRSWTCDTATGHVRASRWISSSPVRRLAHNLLRFSFSCMGKYLFSRRGAWRTGDKKEFHDLAEGLTQSENIAVALVEYRLSTEDAPEIQHPDHILDVYDALHFLVQNAHGYPYDSRRLILVGHSVGAWMALASVMEPDASISLPKNALTMPVLDASVRSAIDTIVLVVCMPYLTSGWNLRCGSDVGRIPGIPWICIECPTYIHERPCRVPWGFESGVEMDGECAKTHQGACFAFPRRRAAQHSAAMRCARAVCPASGTGRGGPSYSDPRARGQFGRIGLQLSRESC